jgi:hypothetical protein
MTRFDGAVLKEQGVEFAIAVVRRGVLGDPSGRARAQAEFEHLFGVPTVLMAQDGRGVPSYWGRRDLVRFLSAVPMEAIPWKTYRFN